jgi:hypothetical protein
VDDDITNSLPEAARRNPPARPHDHRDIAYEVAEHLRDIAGRLQGMKGEAYNWLKAPEYDALRPRLENLHAAAEAALVEARRRVRLNEARLYGGGRRNGRPGPRSGGEATRAARGDDPSRNPGGRNDARGRENARRGRA